MDANWKRAHDALVQLRGEIDRNDPKAGCTHLSEPRRHALMSHIDDVLRDTASVARLGAILVGDASTAYAENADPRNAYGKN